MFRKYATKDSIAIITLLLSLSVIIWRSSGKLAALDQGVASLAGFRSEQLSVNKDQGLLNQKTTEKLARVETMMEMVVKSMGMDPPPRRRDDR